MLAVFGRLHADRDLNALVFGESVMNDAVAIVLYQVISTFGRKPISFLRALYGLWQFVYIFAGSLAIGVAVACVAALLFRSQYFRNEHAPVEAGLVIILAYCSFYICDGIGCGPSHATCLHMPAYAHVCLQPCSASTCFCMHHVWSHTWRHVIQHVFHAGMCGLVTFAVLVVSVRASLRWSL